MNFSEFVKFLKALESTSSHIDKRAILHNLLASLSPEEQPIAIRLLALEYPPVGVSDGNIAIALTKFADRAEIERLRSELGSIESVARYVVPKTNETKLSLTQADAYLQLFAKMYEEGARDQASIQQVFDWLLSSLSQEDTEYMLRFITGRTRIGVQVPTLIDSMASYYGVDPYLINKYYTHRASLYEVVKKLVTKTPLEEVRTEVGIPFHVMLASKANSVEEIMARIKNMAVEWKLDGERVQIHKDGDTIKLFSRRLTDITSEYPEIVEAIAKLQYGRLILDGEIVAVNPRDREEMLPFQVLMRRKRLYNIEQVKEEVPVVVYLFDVINVNGIDYTNTDFAFRRQVLKNVVGSIPFEDDRIRLTPHVVVKSREDLEYAIKDAKLRDLEGVIVKDLDAPYYVGTRSTAWLKLKPSYVGTAQELDLVVVGAYYGEGKRAGKFGSLLLASRTKDGFLETVTRTGTGFSDEVLDELARILKPIKDKPTNLRTNITPDVWVEPNVVVEVIGDDLTLSPVHTAAGGVSLRFPRFIRFRLDRSVNDITTSEEIAKFYSEQRITESKKLPIDIDIV